MTTHHTPVAGATAPSHGSRDAAVIDPRIFDPEFAQIIHDITEPRLLSTIAAGAETHHGHSPEANQ